MFFWLVLFRFDVYSSSPVEILVRVSSEFYESLISQIPKAAHPHSILQSGLKARRYPGSAFLDVVNIRCNEAEAEMLLLTAIRLCPQAAFQIYEGIMLAQRRPNS
jgi:hypothetical protein